MDIIFGSLAKQSFKFGLVFMACLFVSACDVAEKSNDSPSVDVDVDNEQLAAQLSEMQEELRLVIKEVVALNTKFDKLNSAAPSNDGVANQVNVQVEIPQENRLGSPDAKYAIVEFMDYQCPYCVRYAKQVLPKIKSRYIDTGQLQYVIRDYPLDFHAEAEPAAVAARCAGEQNKYWEMHDQLVQNSSRLGSDIYPSLAETMGLDKAKFGACQNNEASLAGVRSDYEYGVKIGTRGTPNFYIGKIEGDKLTNVQKITGARAIDAFDRAIQQVMAGS